MIKKITLTFLVLTFYLISNARFIDNYGIKIGAGLSNQYWEYETMASDLSGWKRNKIGFTGQVFVEKNFGKYISLSPAIGYTQKGFVDDIVLFGAEEENLGVFDNRVVLHDLSLDMSFKIVPFQNRIKPYLLLGLRGDFLVDYRSVIVNYQGENHETDAALYDDFNKFTLSGLVGIGILYNDLSSIEFEFNPAFSRNFKSDILAIHDRFFSLTLGININKLINGTIVYRRS
jgi:hypothetical protein